MTTNLFDIAADLDTPVSAFLKLKPFKPRFLLESVEGGERLARYSFIGFGDCLEVRLDARRPARSAPSACRVPRDQAELLAALRARAGRSRRGPSRACRASRCSAASSASPATTSCATSSGCRRRRGPTTTAPDAHYVAPRSLLVFDHLTRRVALLHAGSEARAAGAAPRGHPRAARRRCRGPAGRRSFGAPDASLSRGRVPRRACARTQGVHRRRRRLPARAVGRASRAAATSIRSRPIARCGC